MNRPQKAHFYDDDRDLLALMAYDETSSEDACDDELFVRGVPTPEAIRMYIEGLLSGEALQCMEAAMAQPETRERTERLRESIEAKKRAMLHLIAGTTSDPVALIDIETSAIGLTRIFMPQVLSCAASEARGGTVHTNDEKALVTLVVTEHLVGDEGILEIEIFTRRDRRLDDAYGEFQVLTDGVLAESYPLTVHNRRFKGKFGIQRRNITSDRVKFRLFLCPSQ